MKERRFAAAQYDRTIHNWITDALRTLNETLEHDLETLRTRSRDASINNEYVRRYLKALRINVIGKGIMLKARARNLNGTFDKTANKKLEKAWDKWSYYAMVDGTCLSEACKLALETVARDGELLVIFRRGPQYGPFQFQLQFLEADHLDVKQVHQWGEHIRSSVEVNELGVPIAYHVYKSNPVDRRSLQFAQQETVRISTRDMLLLFQKERPNQLRGFPWIPAALLALKHLYEYRKSELIASRLASTKSGVIRKPRNIDTETPRIGDEVDTTDDTSLFENLEPGQWNILPEGYDITPIDYQNPNARFKEFSKVILMGTAASLGVSYSTLTGDLESTSYSSLRQGAIDERETYKEIQQWFCKEFLNRVYAEWLSVALRVGAVELPLDLYDKWNSPEWRPRTWNLIDPAKETNSLQMQLKNRIRSLRDVVRDQGRELEDVVDEIVEEEEMFEEKGIPRLLSETSNAATLEQILQENNED